MKLLSCDIENFGTLHELHLEFSEGINRFCYENGWGKSTLMTFLRVMLYGFDGENRKSEKDRERYQMHPWQGGPYGGSISFEKDGKAYCLTRTFGTKPDQDRMEIRECSTNLPTDIFGTEPGKALFRIDRDSFVRTVYIGQNEIEGGTTGDINAKIGNLTDNTSDINNYESAMIRIKNTLNAMNPARVTGSLNKTGKQIAALKTELHAEESLLESMERLRALSEETAMRRRELSTEQELLSGRIYEVGLRKDRMRQAEAYHQLCESYQEALSAYESLGPFDRTDGERLDAEIRTAGELLALWNERTTRKTAWKITQENRQRERDALLQEQLRLEQEAAAETRKRNTFLAIGAVFLAAALVSFLLIGIRNMNFLLPIILAGVLGLILVIAALVLFSGKSDGRIQEVRDDNAYPNPQDTDLAKEKAEIVHMEEQVRSYLQDRGVPFDENKAGSDLQYIYSTSIRNASEEKARKNLMDNACRKLEDAKEAKSEFEKKNPVEQLLAVDLSSPLPDLAELTHRFNKNAEQLEILNHKARTYEEQIQDLTDQYEDLLLKKNHMESLSRTYEAEKKRFTQIELAGQLLTKAKQTLSARYIEPIQRTFLEYYYLIRGTDTDIFRMDANTRLTYESYGMQRDTSSLSRGQQDLTWLCLRLALVKAMYPEERPVIIMDDTFVNLDARNTEGAIRLLEHIAGEFQIIYFTCK